MLTASTQPASGKSAVQAMAELPEHPRFSVPFGLKINGRHYEGVEISLSGLTALGLMDRWVDETRKAVIEFPFAGFNVDLKTDLILLDSSTDSGLVRFAFADPMGNHRVALQSIFNAYISGELTHIPGLIGGVANVKSGVAASAKVSIITRAIKWMSGLFRSLVLTALGVVLVAFVVERVHQRFYIYVPTTAAFITVKATPIPSRKTGAVVTLTPQAAPGQTLFAVLGDDGIMTTVNMPCDCVVAQTFVEKGGVAVMGDPVVSVMQPDAKPYVSTLVKSEIIPALGKDIGIRLHFANGRSMPAFIKSIVPGRPAQNDAAGAVEVLLDPLLPIEIDRLGEPVLVTFDTGPAWIRSARLSLNRFWSTL